MHIYEVVYTYRSDLYPLTETRRAVDLIEAESSADARRRIKALMAVYGFFEVKILSVRKTEK